MGQIFAAVKQLRRLLSAHCPGSPHCLHAISDDGSALSKDKAYFILAHFRGSNPRLSLFALADLRADDILQTRTIPDGGLDFEWQVDVTTVGSFFTENQSAKFTLNHTRLIVDPSFYSPRGNEQMMLTTQANAPSQIFPPPVKVRKVGDHALAKAMKQGMENLPSEKTVASVPAASVPCASDPGASVPAVSVPDASVSSASVPSASVPGASVPHVAPWIIGSMDNEGASSDGVAESATSDDHSVDAPSSDVDTEEDQFQEERRAKQPRKETQKFYFGCGQVLINTAGKSLDVRCNLCQGGFDRSWKGRSNARQPHTRAQGRMLGSYFAWLRLPCSGDPLEHEDLFSDEGSLCVASMDTLIAFAVFMDCWNASTADPKPYSVEGTRSCSKWPNLGSHAFVHSRITTCRQEGRESRWSLKWFL